MSDFKGVNMEKYKKLIAKFVEDIEKLDEKCDLEKLSTEDEELLYIIRDCRNRLIDVHNKIGDKVWIMPNMRNKVKEYISELDEEISRCEKLYEDVSVGYSDPTRSLTIQCRIETLSQVKGDLKSRLEELV